MANPHERGRSPSAGQTNNHLRHGTSASPHPPLPSPYTGITTVNAQSPYNDLTVPGATSSFNDPTFSQDFSSQAQYSLDPTFTNFQEQQQQQGYSDGNFIQHNTYLSPNDSLHTGAIKSDSSAFPTLDFTQADFNESADLDPSLLDGLDQTNFGLIQEQDDSTVVNPAFDHMAAATLQSHSSTPPHLHPDMISTHRKSGSPSPHASPSFQQTAFQPMIRTHNPSESLDPSSAMFPPHQNEWTNMGAYGSHRRSASDQLSDISSNNPSPYMASLDNFDGPNGHSSPLLNSTLDPSFHDGLGLQAISLADGHMVHGAFSSHSPAHSPGHSPHLMPQQPQQALPAFTAEDNYGLGNTLNGSFSPQPNGLDMYNTSGQEAFPSLNTPSPGEMGPVDHLSPPEISIQYAPPSRTLTENNEISEDTLSPPTRTNRARAKSDSHAGSRPTTPAVTGRGRSPSLQPSSALETYTASRSQSPNSGRGRNNSVGNRSRASSASASDQRDYILELADPQRSSSNGDPRGRQQRHPATFQCTLCPKRFTRAYNLRSHLRTHTDERPFVCTVCGKAFARQHDRKRHESLHSGEKKFVCRGTLQSGSQWGCGRRFARADALGRHFRSEAGRVCIKPLLEEEAAEREKAWLENAQQQQQQQQQQQAYLVPQVDMLNNFLPAALLAQYPALAGIDWNAVPPGNPPNEDDYSGRSSFDASSGGEYNEDMSENEMGSFQDLDMGGMNGVGLNQSQNYYTGDTSGDYLNEYKVG